MSQYDTIIVANGEPPAHPEALRLLREARTVVCCDGAVSGLVALGVEPAVIVGDGDHAEVIGLMGYTHGKGVVVSGPEEASKLPQFERVNVVSQTTQKESVFYATAEEIKKHAAVCQVSNTICQPTKDRQKETMEQASNADLVIVVGGRHSANTTRLALLCKGLAPAVQHVETEMELDEDLIKKAPRIFITAGASTPDWVIDRVAVRVKEIHAKTA